MGDKATVCMCVYICVCLCVRAYVCVCICICVCVCVCVFTHHSEVVRWMGDKATELGVDILPGFPARSLLYDGHNGVCGVTTQDQGLNKQ
jgi:hypothetical protein